MLTKRQTRNYYALLRFIFSLLFFSFCVPLLTSCESKKTIVNGLEEKEANEILVFLADKGISSEKIQEATGGAGGSKIVLYHVDVPTERATEAMALLNQAGLPRRKIQNLLNIFSGSGLVPSDLEQKIRYEAGLAEQVASTIRKIDGVLDADVQLSFPREDPLNPGQYKGKITASVFVKHNGILDDPNSHLITKIKRLVASSVTGLNYDDVTVIPVRANVQESTTSSFGNEAESEKHYVNVWSLIIAQESLLKFRIIFFSFVTLIFGLLLILVWILWKVWPVLHRHGGIKELFHLHPIKLEPKPDEAAEEAKKGTEASKKEAKTEEEDKDVDIT
jgi:type III secretion protein J